MSGGHYDYAYHKIAEFAENLELSHDRLDSDGMNKPNPPPCPRRLKFKKLLTLVAEAAKAVEWADSGDSGEDEAEKAMDMVFDFLSLGKAPRRRATKGLT